MSWDTSGAFYFAENCPEKQTAPVFTGAVEKEAKSKSGGLG
jgi:hypothetical protein